MHFAGRWELCFIHPHSSRLTSNVVVSVAEEKATLEGCKLAIKYWSLEVTEGISLNQSPHHLPMGPGNDILSVLRISRVRKFGVNNITNYHHRIPEFPHFVKN